MMGRLLRSSQRPQENNSVDVACQRNTGERRPLTGHFPNAYVCLWGAGVCCDWGRGRSLLKVLGHLAQCLPLPVLFLSPLTPSGSSWPLSMTLLLKNTFLAPRTLTSCLWVVARLSRPCELEPEVPGVQEPLALRGALICDDFNSGKFSTSSWTTPSGWGVSSDPSRTCE